MDGGLQRKRGTNKLCEGRYNLSVSTMFIDSQGQVSRFDIKSFILHCALSGALMQRPFLVNPRKPGFIIGSLDLIE